MVVLCWSWVWMDGILDGISSVHIPWAQHWVPISLSWVLPLPLLGDGLSTGPTVNADEKLCNGSFGLVKVMCILNGCRCGENPQLNCIQWWGTNKYQEQEKNGREKTRTLWIPLSSHVFSSLHYISKSWKSLVHINVDGTSRSLSFIVLQMGADQGIGRRGLWLATFGGQIDGEAVTRMSGRHQSH